MQIFSPDGKYGYVCSSFKPEIDVISVADHAVVGRVPQASPFCPNIAATPDGSQVWFTLKDTGKTQVFDARPPFAMLKTLDTGPITNHVNIVRNANGHVRLRHGRRAGRDQGVPDRRLRQVATIPVGKAAAWHLAVRRRLAASTSAWRTPTRLAAIDTLTNKVIATVPIGQAPQAVTYVPDAVPEGSGTQGLQPLGIAGEAAHLALAPLVGGKPSGDVATAPTSVTLFDQGLVQVVQAAVTGLEPRQAYVLALVDDPTGNGAIESLASFMTNPAGAAIVNSVGPIRQIVQGEAKTPRRYLVLLEGHAGEPRRAGPDAGSAVNTSAD